MGLPCGAESFGSSKPDFGSNLESREKFTIQGLLLGSRVVQDPV